MRGGYEGYLFHAASRHVERYPTVARMAARRTDLIEVGTYDYGQRTLTVTNRTELEGWSNEFHRT